MVPEVSLPCSQEPATGPCSESDESSPQLPTLSVRSILILSAHLHLLLQSVLFSSGLPTKIVYEFITSPMSATRPVHLILLNLIILIIFSEMHRL